MTGASAPTRFDNVSFLTDFGTADEFVGVCKSVVWSIAPHVRIVDITHEVEPHDVRAGGLALARAAEFLLPGVVLGVVDPGVGSDRKPVVIEVGDGQSYLVGPDNGLFAPAVGMVGGATGAVVLDNAEYQLPGLGATFDGRDRFSPAAAHLCNGVPMSELGTTIDPALLMPGVIPVSQMNAEGAIEAEVLWVDRFGNVQLNVDPAALGDWDAVQVVGEGLARTASRAGSFAQIAAGGVGLLSDSNGLLALAINRGSAAAELGLAEGDSVSLQPSDVTGTRSSVVLTPTRKNPES